MSEGADQSELRLHERQPLPRDTWQACYKVVFGLFLLGLAADTARRGFPRGAHDARWACVQAAFGLTVASCYLFALLHRRRWIELGPDGIRDVRVAWPAPTIAYADVRTVRLRRRGSGRPVQLVIVTARGRIGLSMGLPGWPRLLSLLIERAPSLALDMPDPLAERLRALVDGRLESVVLETDTAFVTPREHLQVALLPDRVTVEDADGQRREVPWGEVIAWSSVWDRPGGSVLISTADDTLRVGRLDAMAQPLERVLGEVMPPLASLPQSLYVHGRE